MKKSFKISLIICLVLSMVISLGIMIYAAENSETVPQQTEDIEQDADDSRIDQAIEAISSSSFWVALITFIISLISTVILIVKKFKQVIGIISQIAPHSLTSAESSRNTKEIKEAVMSGFSDVSEQLRQSKEDYKLLLAIFTVFIENTKMNANAKAEILGMIHKIKPLSDNVPEAIDEALEHIRAANAAEEKINTPALDAAIAINETSGMSLD